MPGWEEEDTGFGDEEHTEVLDLNAVGMVETMSQLQLRTATKGGTCYVKDDGVFYVFDGDKWVPEDDD